MQKLKIYFNNDQYEISAKTYGSNIEILFDNDVTESTIVFDTSIASDLAELLLAASGEWTTSQWQDRVYSLENNLEDAEETIDILRERRESYWS